MQGTIAQLIALTTYGNACLAGTPAFDPAAFFRSHSTFAYCESVRFADVLGQGEAAQEAEYAPDPPAWYAGLRRDGVYAIRTIHAPSGGQMIGDRHVPDRMLTGFVGSGGRWLMEAVSPGGSDFWEARWDAGDRERADRRIWRVTYRRISSARPTWEPAAIDPGLLKQRLGDNLMATADFARARKLEDFARAFDAGLAGLSSPDPYSSADYQDIAPGRALPLTAAQLLTAAQSAWVFGGMDSWNDIAIDADDEAIYERLSEELYQLLIAAIVTGANASAPPIAAAPRKPWWKIW